MEAIQSLFEKSPFIQLFKHCVFSIIPLDKIFLVVIWFKNSWSKTLIIYSFYLLFLFILL